MFEFYLKKIAIAILLLVCATAGAQQVTLDEFEDAEGWSFIQSDGVELNISSDTGMTGNAVRFDYVFEKGTGYGGMQKWFPIDLPDNYEFTFYIKATSPANNFEIKFIDSTGNNVWWVNNRNYDFPAEWKKVRIKKRHIEFAWGPTEDRNLKRIDRIEFTVASYVGGKGTLWIDDLKFEPLPPEATAYPDPIISASSSEEGHTAEMMIDQSPKTSWQSTDSETQVILLDFLARREFGGLKITWDDEQFATRFDVFLSEDGTTWEQAYEVRSNKAETSFIRLPEAEAKLLKLILTESNSKACFGIREIEIMAIENSLTKNDFLIYTAKNSSSGDYPRYFLEEASYWTVSGVNNDVKEALINEDGMVEVDKGLFSIEPMIKSGNTLYNWSNVRSSQSLGYEDGQDFQFLPTVAWEMDQLELRTALMASGTANESSVLDIRYSMLNFSSGPKDIELYLLIRPFQVNPYYQWLNITGGAGQINSVHGEGRAAARGDRGTVRGDIGAGGAGTDGDHSRQRSSAPNHAFQ